jgi:hypothetical protein
MIRQAISLVEPSKMGVNLEGGFHDFMDFLDSVGYENVGRWTMKDLKNLAREVII